MQPGSVTETELEKQLKALGVTVKKGEPAPDPNAAPKPKMILPEGFEAVGGSDGNVHIQKIPGQVPEPKPPIIPPITPPTDDKVLKLMEGMTQKMESMGAELKALKEPKVTPPTGEPLPPPPAPQTPPVSDDPDDNYIDPDKIELNGKDDKQFKGAVALIKYKRQNKDF